MQWAEDFLFVNCVWMPINFAKCPLLAGKCPISAVKCPICHVNRPIPVLKCPICLSGACKQHVDQGHKNYESASLMVSFFVCSW